MNGWQIIGPAPHPGVAYQLAQERKLRAEQEQRQRYSQLVTTRAASGACPACRFGGFDGVRCAGCDYRPRHNGQMLNQRSAHAHPCPGCQYPTTLPRCKWCQHWEAVEARAVQRFATVSEDLVNRLGSVEHSSPAGSRVLSAR
jgi:hypothetical protein